MKEIISSGGCDAITKDAVYKDVVVVGEFIFDDNYSIDTFCPTRIELEHHKNA